MSELVRGYEVVIGFETHAQLSTNSKIFSRASTQFGAEANTQACPVDIALPGTLPVMNRAAVQRAIEYFEYNLKVQFGFDFDFKKRIKINDHHVDQTNSMLLNGVHVFFVGTNR